MIACTYTLLLLVDSSILLLVRQACSYAFAHSLAGLTWLLSNEVVRMAETIWLQQLQIYTHHVASASQCINSHVTLVSDWLLHQQGLYALGMTLVILVGQVPYWSSLHNAMSVTDLSGKVSEHNHLCAVHKPLLQC